MRSLEARRMQVYAAMTEAMDFHISAEFWITWSGRGWRTTRW